MTPLEGLGRALVGFGAMLLFLGLALVLGARLGLPGRLPGDILVRRGNFTLYFPVVTMLLLSLVLTLLLNLLRR